MKNMYLVLALFFIIPSSMKSDFTVSKQEATIVITSDLLTCKSELQHNQDEWIVKHVKPLKRGRNYFDFVSRGSQRIEIIVTNY